MTVYGRETDAEDAIVGGSPQQAVVVVVHVADVVRTEAVLFRHPEHLVAVLVDEDDTIAIGGQCLQTIPQVFHLVDLHVDTVCLAVTSGDLFANSPQIAAMMLDIHFLVAGQEVYLALLFPYPLHLALERFLGWAGYHCQVALVVGLQETEVVVATCPDSALGILEDSRDACDAL